MTTYVWVYRSSTHMLIVKREPFAHRNETRDPATGLVYVDISPGTRIALPKWDWVTQTRTGVYASIGNIQYDITDLYQSS
jgi:hypothetical protein